MSKISRALETYLPHELFGLLGEIGKTAGARGEAAYLVGGVVRDLLLGQPNLDLDLVVEGKAIPLARQLAKAKNWGVRTHPRFGTAKLYWKDFSLDLVTARSETYGRPGALPTVKPGTIQDDLFRRDFTINAMAVHLSPESFGELIDPHGGQRDLEERLIRILHRRSFSDDPTRILRALRYEQRLDFRLEQDTEGLIQRDLDKLDAVTGERLWHELELILEEECPEKAICRADELSVLPKLCPALKGDDWLAGKFTQARRMSDNSLSMPVVYLALLVGRLTEDESEGCVARLKMPGWAARTVRDTRRLAQSLPALAAPGLRPRGIYHQLERHSAEVIKATAITSDSLVIQQRIDLYLSRLRHVRTSLRGEDLQSMGVMPGRKMGQILRAMHDAKLDQEVTSREEEEAFVRRVLAGGKG